MVADRHRTERLNLPALSKEPEMAISLEDERPDALPVVKLPNVNDAIIGAIVDMETGDAYDLKTKLPKVKDNGKPCKRLVLTIRVVRCDGETLVGLADDLHKPIEGELARIIVEGGTWKWWIEAKQNHHIEVGDFVRWQFAEIVKNDTQGHNDYKNRKFTLRKPKPAEQFIVAECEQHHQDLKRSAAAINEPVEATSDF